MRWLDRPLTRAGWLLSAASAVPMVVLLTYFDRLAPWTGPYGEFKVTRVKYVYGAIAIGIGVFVVGAWLLQLGGRRVFRDRPQLPDSAGNGTASDGERR